MYFLVKGVQELFLFVKFSESARACEDLILGIVPASGWMWAPLDSAFSIYFGVYTEALFNIGAVTGYAIPLIATYRDFFPKAADS